MLNQISKVAGVGFAVTLALALSANNAQALDFSFSFDNVEGNTPGTVEGTITGLNEGTGAADSVLITSFPAGLGGSFDAGNDATLWSNQGANTFTVTNGSITDADFNSDSSNGSNLCLNCSEFGGVNGTINGSTGNALFNFDGFSGATYSTAATSVPFGVSTDLSIIILGGLYGASRLRKKFAASK